MAAYPSGRRPTPLCAAVLVSALAAAAPAQAADLQHLRLIDRLDRPSDGYCIDIPGTPGNMQLEVPLFAHNCKRGLPPDAAVTFTDAGRIRFPGPDRCVTAAGVAGKGLPKTALILRRCGGRQAFFDAAPLQAFTLRPDGALVLKGSDLCLTVGSVSARTYSPADRWRALYLDTCGAAPAKFARWEFVTPDR